MKSHGRGLCPECGRERRLVARGLCQMCYLDLSIRIKYVPNDPKIAYGMSWYYQGTPSIAPSPTEALPGTEEKILVLIERASLKQQLFHPDDKRAEVEEIDPSWLIPQNVVV